MLIKNSPPPKDPVGRCLGPYGGPKGGGVLMSNVPLHGTLFGHNVSINQFQKVNSPTNLQLDISISNSKQQVDDFVGELTF